MGVIIRRIAADKRLVEVGGDFTKLPYKVYLETTHWNKTRKRILKFDGWKCVKCGSKKSLKVHHRTYERLGQELLEDLVTLCSVCHATLHGSGKPIDSVGRPKGGISKARRLRRR
jgi:hypothetical protein